MSESAKLLNEFLMKHKVGENNSCTHTAFGQPWGKFYIDENNDATFISLYKKTLMEYLYNDVEPDLHIIERPNRVSLMVIDIDLRQKSQNRIYTEEHVKNIIQRFTAKITAYNKISKTDINAFVFEKQKPSYDAKQDNYKDGFHIIYPDVILDASMRYLIMEEATIDIEKDRIFDNLNILNTYDDIIDKSIVYRNGWLMYGSRKDKSQLYYISKIYDGDNNEIDHSAYSPDELVVMLSVRQHDEEDMLKLNSNYNNSAFKAKLGEIYEKYHGNKENKKKIISKKLDIQKMTIQIDDINRIPSKDTEMAKKLCRILSKKRADDYKMWLYVGWTLHNIDNTMLDTYIEFSKQSEKYTKDCCEKIWIKASKAQQNDASDNKLTVASLHWWAKEDNPEDYLKLMRELINAQMDKAKMGAHDDIAKMAYQLYKHNYRCASITKNQWYEFNDRWMIIDKGYTLANKLTDELTVEFSKMAGVYFMELQNKDGDERDKAMQAGKDILKIVDKLKNSSYINSAMEACARRFHDSHFEEKLDENPYLIGFNNGIYDLKNGCFRKGTPDDYITLTTGYDYIEFEENSEEIKVINEYFSKVMIDIEMRDYILTLLASYLDGRCKDQNFVIWTGTGSNGKSTTLDLMRYTMGDYFGVLPTTVITKKRTSSSNATPELADKRGKRCLPIQEPEHDDVIYVGNMKNLTGCDWIEARALYGMPFMYKPQFKLLLTCNKLPHIPSHDGGTLRRLRVTPWESEFIDGKPKKPNQFPKDRDLCDKLKGWAPGLMWILLNKYYPIYDKQGLKEPAKVKLHTEKYKKDTDIYYEFIQETYNITNNSEDNEGITSAYCSFKSWHMEAYSSKAPPKKDFMNYLTDAGYKIHNNSIQGIKYKG